MFSSPASSPDSSRLPALLRLFETPPRPTEDLPARRLMEQAERTRLRVEENDIACYAWGPREGRKVLLVHGWGSRAADLALFIPPLIKAGHRVLAFDAPAHGDTPGERSSMLRFARTIAALSQLHGGFYAIIGHSLGAAASCYRVGKDTPLTRSGGVRVPVERLALLALPATLPGITTRFIKQNAMTPEEAKAFFPAVEKYYGLRHDEFFVVKYAASFTMPVLLIHSDDDPEAPISDVRTLAKALPDALLEEHQGLGHAGLLTARDVARSVVRFVTEDGTSLARLDQRSALATTP